MHTTPRFALLAAVPVLALALAAAACGGSVATGEEGANSNGTKTPSPSGSGAPVGNCTMAPACDATETAYANASACPQDVTCREQTVCGSSVWCAPKGASCAPVGCRPGFIEVKSCVPDSKCVTEVSCGRTIICQGDAQCDGYPNCDAGHTQVANQAACPQDASCYSKTLCGTTIWCTDAAVP